MSNKSKTLPKICTRSWNSLTDVMRYLEKDGRETIVSFDGSSLVTNKGRYGLANSQLTFIPNESL